MKSAIFCAYRVSIIAEVIWGSPTWKGGTRLRAEVLLPNWKPKEVEVGKRKIARFLPAQYCKKGGVATCAESLSVGSLKVLNASGVCRSKLAALS